MRPLLGSYSFFASFSPSSLRQASLKHFVPVNKMSSFSTEDMQAVRAQFPALVAADSGDSRASGYSKSCLSSPSSLLICEREFTFLICVFLSVLVGCCTVYAENAGGSQVLSSVASSISSYLLSTNVQMAAYPLAATAASQVSLGNSAAAVLLGANSPDEVMIGQSATSLVFSLSLMIEAKVLADRKEGKAEAWKEGDEMIVSDADHETNRGAWVRLAERLGLKVKHWPVTPIPRRRREEQVRSNPRPRRSFNPRNAQNANRCLHSML